MFRQTTFIRPLKKSAKFWFYCRIGSLANLPNFLLSTLKLFFSKQQTPATKKMMVQYFAVCCQQSSFAVPPKSLHFERTREKGTAFSSSFQPHFQHYNRPYYFTFKSLFLILESSNQDYRRSKQPSSKINEFFMI